MKVDFRRLTWENYPSTETPINADNLNRLEEGVAGLYSDVAEIEQELGDGVGEYVTDWLNEHLDPVGSAVVVDDTLTIQGAAADAKKTGDEITSLKEDIKDYAGIADTQIVAQDGRKLINGSGAIVTASGTFHVSEPIPVTAGSEIHFIATGNTSNFTMIATCDSTGGSIASRVNAISDGAEHDYIYKMDTDGYIMLSWNFSYATKLVILSEIANAKLKQSIDSIKELTSDYCGVEEIAFKSQDGRKYITPSGTISGASGTFHVSEPIPVTVNTEVHFIAVGNTNSFVMIATCDSEGSSITPKVNARTDGLEHDYSYTTVEDGYIMLSYNYSHPTKLIFEKSYSNLNLNEKINSLDDAVSDFKGTVVTTNANLFNHREMIDKKVVSTSGVVSGNIEYAITEHVTLKPNTVYSYRELYRINFYQSDDTHISEVELWGTETGTFTTPENLAYAVVTIHKNTSAPWTVFAEYKWQLVEGETLPEYEPQNIVINGYQLIDSAFTVGGETYAFRRWNKTCFDSMPVVFAETESDAVTAADCTTAAIIAKYDALMTSNPNYISKSEIGTASDGQTMYQYDFVMPKIKELVETTEYDGEILPKIICISGVHPEFGGIYGMYNAFREITTNPNLTNLKYGVHFVVIPVANPYGVDNKKRSNANGIDQARGYEVDYAPNSGSHESDTWTGTEPLSEPETQAIDAVMASNKDAILFMSCHSFQRSAQNYVMWGACATRYVANLVGKTIYKMSGAWRKKYPSIIPSDTTLLGNLSLATEPGAEGKQATKYGIQGLTFETSDYFPLESQTSLSSFAISRNSETYINFILTALGCWESTDPKDITKVGLR